MKRYLAALTALCAAPLVAQEAGDTEAAARAETASRVIQGIREGSDLKMVEGLFGLSTAEYAELARLKGCSDTAVATSNDNNIVVHWTCGAGTAAPGLTRATRMIFDEGVLVGFAVNPQLSEFAPASGSTPALSPSGKKDLAEKFATMVAARQSDRVSAFVPVNDDQTARLDYFGGGKFRISKPQDGRVPVRFKAVNGQELESFVHFDAAGYAIGLTFAPTACANCDEWVRGESQRRFDDRRRRDRSLLQTEANRRNIDISRDPNVQKAIRRACPDCP